MNCIDPDKRAAAIAMLAEGRSIRSTARELGLHKNTVASLAPRKHVRQPKGYTYKKGADGLNKFQRYHARKRAKGEYEAATCSDCGGPRNIHSAARCYQCWRRTAALKKLAANHPEDSEEYATGVVEIFGTTFTNP